MSNHYKITCDVSKFNQRQTFFFVMSSRRKNAQVVEAHIAQADAQRAARRIDSCVRFGYVQDGKAVTL